MSLGSQFGLLSTGFVQKQIADVTADLQAAVQAALGASVNVTPQSRLGQIIGIMAARYVELWNAASAVHSAFNPDAATGSDLANVAAITGTTPAVPQPTQVSIACTGTPGTVLATGRVVGVPSGPTPIFQTTSPITLNAITAWAQNTVYNILSTIRTANGNIYKLTGTGTSNVAGTGPSGTGSAIADGSCTWAFVGVGTAYALGTAQSPTNGAFAADVGTVSVIKTPVAGWNTVTNFGAATPGVANEPDSTFRIRRTTELQGPGKAAVNAVQAALSKLTGVTLATVFENLGDVVDANGVPAHSLEAMVLGSTPAAIAAAIFQNKSAGINTYGNQASVNVGDTSGIVRAILFSRPVYVPVYVTVNAIVDASKFPSNGATLISNAIMAYSASLVPGLDVVSSQIAAAIIAGVPSQVAAGVVGVLDAGTPFIGLAANPVSTATVPIAPRQIGQLDPSRITVNTTNGVP